MDRPFMLIERGITQTDKSAVANSAGYTAQYFAFFVHQQFAIIFHFKALGPDRTGDLLITSEALYQLSYKGKLQIV